MPEFHVGLVEIAAMFVAGIFSHAWLKFESNQHKKDIEMLWKKHDSLELRMITELSDIGKSLARIEGRLQVDSEKKQS